MMASNLRAFLAGCGALLVGCSEPPTTVDDLVIQFRLSRTSAHPGDRLEARLVVSNPTARSITLSSGDSCVAMLEVRKDGQRVALEGTSFACLTVVSYFEIAPHDSLVRTFPLVVMLQSDRPPWGYVVRPPAGVYRVQALMNVRLPDPVAELQVVD